MRYITLAACLLAFAVALAAMWPQPQPHWERSDLGLLRNKPHYGIRNYCADHPDVCRRGSRMVRYSTPSPIPQLGYVEVRP